MVYRFFTVDFFISIFSSTLNFNLKFCYESHWCQSSCVIRIVDLYWPDDTWPMFSAGHLSTEVVYYTWRYYARCCISLCFSRTKFEISAIVEGNNDKILVVITGNNYATWL